MKIYKYHNGTLVVAEVRKTKKMYVVDKVLDSKPGYFWIGEGSRLYEHQISFTPEEAFGDERNKLNTRIVMYKEAMEKAVDDLELLEKVAGNN